MRTIATPTSTMYNMVAVVGTSAGWLPQLQNLWETSYGAAGILRNWYDDANPSSSYFTDFVLRR